MGAALFRAFRSELLKVRRTWLVLGTFGPLLAFSVISTVIQFQIAYRVGPILQRAGLQNTEDLARPDGLARVLVESAAFGGVIVVVLFATGYASEYGWGTLRNLLVRQPDRTSLMAGKFVGLLDLIFVGRIIASIFAVAAAVVMAALKDIPTEAWFSPEGLGALAHALVNLMLSAIGWAALGTLAAIVFRSPGAAVGSVLAFFPVEGLVSAWWDDAPRWLPGQLLDAVANGGSEATSYSRALGLTLGASLVALFIANWIFNRADVTA